MQMFMKTIAALALLGAMPSHEAFASGHGMLEVLPSMALGRAAHTLTTLHDGSVLVVGGFTTEEQQIAGVELFDPQHGRFQVIADAITPRQSHTASLLSDGRVLITGGYNAQVSYLDTAEIFDPATRRFSPAGRMHAPRASHSAVTLVDGRVALIGGGSTDWTFLDSIEIYDPKTGAFSEAGRMTAPRGGSVAVPLHDGRIFIAGGHRGRGSTLEIYDSSEIFDPRTARSTPAASMSSPRDKHDGVVLADGRVLITGGSNGKVVRTDTAEIFDPSRNAFRRAGTMIMARFKHRGSSLLLPNGTVLIAGGAQQPEVYDCATDTFRAIETDLRVQGHFSAVALLQDQRALITGGYFRAGTTSNRAWVYEHSRAISKPETRIAGD